MLLILERKYFIKTLIGGMAMASLQPFYNWLKRFTRRR